MDGALAVWWLDDVWGQGLVSGRVSHPLVACLVVAVLLSALLGGQAVAALTAPAEPTVAIGATLGRSGFAYLGGLRRFAAAVLWNRIDPQVDEYRTGQPISERTEFLATMRIVQLLDPQFEQNYYVASYILAANKRWDEALELAHEGVENNPQSGFMRVNYAQLLMIQDAKKNLPEMLDQAKKALEPSTTWANTTDQYEGYGVLRAVFRLAGDTEMDSRLAQAQEALKAQDAGQGTEQGK